ncbi:MAG: ribosome maturation factor RimM [Eubacteriales bacterium]|nr:ribosome maturation factor RimM [Eubacteriales bacterium]
MTDKSRDRVLIGEVTGAIGIRGEIKVYSYAEDISRFHTLESVYISGIPYEIRKVREKGNLAVLALSGIEDRNEAEKLRGKPVEMDAEELPALPEDQFYIRDILGLSVFDESGRELGLLKDVLTDRPQQILVVARKGRKDILIPMVSEFVREILPEEGKIIVRLIEGMEDE